MEKKGQAIQFNWMFVFIAGAFILLFFVGFSVNYFQLGEQKINAEISRGLDQIFSGSKSTSQYKNFTLDSKKFNIDFNCPLIIVNEDSKLEVDYPLFGSDSNQIDKLIVWSREFISPFRVDNIVYVANPRDKIYSDDFIFKSGFPETLSFATNLNDADIAIFFNSCPSFSGKKICVNSGNINFDTGETYPYYDDSLVYAAALSDYDNFKCSVDKLNEKWSNLFKIYSRKLDYLTGCSNIREDLQVKFNQASLLVNQSHGLGGLEEDLINLNRNLMTMGCEVAF